MESLAGTSVAQERRDSHIPSCYWGSFQNYKEGTVPAVKRSDGTWLLSVHIHSSNVFHLNTAIALFHLVVWGSRIVQKETVKAAPATGQPHVVWLCVTVYSRHLIADTCTCACSRLCMSAAMCVTACGSDIEVSPWERWVELQMFLLPAVTVPFQMTLSAGSQQCPLITADQW